MNKITKILLKLSLISLFLTPAFASAAELKMGDLVKLENSTSVYQIQFDGTKKVFPTESVYKSHYDNFDNVKIISIEELRNYLPSGNVTLKIDSLIKFDNNNKVYQVKGGKELEWIKSEDGIKNLGHTFSEVINLPEILFTDYSPRSTNGSYDEVLSKIKDNFLYQDKIESVTSIATSSKGLIESLDDDYSVFYNAEEYKEFINWMDNSTFEGIGAQIEIRDDRLTIVSPLKGSPAESAGLLANDKVMFIDDYDTTGMSLNKSVMLIRGPKGEIVVLKVKRESSDDLIAIPIARDTIEVPQFEWETKQTLGEKNIAYLNLSQFSLTGWQDFVEASSDVLATEPDGMILDLRNNPGGYLSAAISIANRWLESDTIIMQEKKINNKQKLYIASVFNIYQDIPLVVLINKGSASASEIVAGALQDHKVATIMGQTSFGKGVVQEIISLSDGNVIKLTISEWFTPNGNQIQGIGVTPDIIVGLPEKIVNSDSDIVLERALEELDTLISGSL